ELMEIQVHRGHHDAHRAGTEDLLHAVLPREDLSHLDRRRSILRGTLAAGSTIHLRRSTLTPRRVDVEGAHLGAAGWIPAAPPQRRRRSARPAIVGALMARTNLPTAALASLIASLAACKGGAIMEPDAGNGDIEGTDGLCGTCAYVYVNGGIPCGPGP